MNTRTIWEEYCGRIDELIAEDPDRYRSRYEAGLEVKRRYPHLADAKPSSEAVRAKPTVIATGNAEAQLNAAARQIAASEGIGAYEACVEAVAQRPELYRRYLRQRVQ